MADGYSTRDRAPHQGRGSKTSPSSSPEGARDKGSGMSRRVEAQGKGSALVARIFRGRSSRQNHMAHIGARSHAAKSVPFTGVCATYGKTLL